MPRPKRRKTKPLAAMDGMLDPKPLPPVPKLLGDPIPDSGPFPPKGKVFEPNGRGLVPLRNDKEYELYLNELAPMEDLRQALALAGGDKALNFLSDIIRNSKPRRTKGPTLATMAKRNGLAMDQIAEIWRSYSMAKGITTIASSAPKVAEHVVESSLNTNIICPRCDGHGKVNQPPEPLGLECPTCYGARRITKIIQTALGDERPIDLDCPKCAVPSRVPCKQCSGTGLIRKSGDADSRKLLFETMGWTKGRQPAVNVNINAGHTVESVLDELEDAIPVTFSRA